MKPNRQLIIIRHGQAEHNLSRQFNSNPEHPNYQVSNLSPQGILQAQEAGAEILKLGFDSRSIEAVYVSPLERTLQTAEEALKIIGYTDQPTEDIRLTERQAGQLEGATIHDFASQHEEHGEKQSSVKARALSFCNDISRRHPHGNILVVSHGTPSSMLVELTTGTCPNFTNGEVIVVPLA